MNLDCSGIYHTLTFIQDKTPQHATDLLTLDTTHLALLDDIGALHAVVHVAAGVVTRVPLTAPRTGHT